MTRVSSRIHIVFYICLGLLLGWLLIPLPYQYAERRASSTRKASVGLLNYFGGFDGYSECNIRAAELYSMPPKDKLGFYDYNTFCHDRKHLLQAMSDGGRVGFDAPYRSRGCNYRWFDTEEMCFILERFDGLIFAGDDTLQTIYGGLNILLRQDLAHGTLDLASMEQSLHEDCRCNHQFVKTECRQHYLIDSSKASKDDHAGSTYFCNRVRHAFIKTEAAELDSDSIDKFRELAPKASRSKYRPIPIVHSLSPAVVSAADAEASLRKFVELADDSTRNTPMLWIGPTAAGHIELKNRKGNQEIWDFDRKMASVAQQLDVEVLSMWNMTIQATSWDGMRFGEKVAITQAMMLMNWLSRVESS